MAINPAAVRTVAGMPAAAPLVTPGLVVAGVPVSAGWPGVVAPVGGWLFAPSSVGCGGACGGAYDGLQAAGAVLLDHDPAAPAEAEGAGACDGPHAPP